MAQLTFAAGSPSSAPAGELPGHLDDPRDQGRDDLLAGLAARLGRVADDTGRGDVAQHVHRHDRRPAPCASSRTCRTTSTADRPLAPLRRGRRHRGVASESTIRWPSASASEVSASSAWIIGPSIAARTSAARSHHWTRKTRRPVVSIVWFTATVSAAMLPPWPLTAIRRSKPWWASESQTSRKTCRNVVVESLQAAGELHVVPGERHVQRRRHEQPDALLLPRLGGAAGRARARSGSRCRAADGGRAARSSRSGAARRPHRAVCTASTSGQVIRSRKCSVTRPPRTRR